MDNNHAKPPEEKQDRLKKLELMKEFGMMPYADRYERTHTIAEARELPLETPVKVAGRIVLFRDMGKLAFARMADLDANIQIVFRLDELGEADYKKLQKIISVGDFLGIEGTIFATQKGELSVLAKQFTFLSKAIMPLPEKWHGLKDQEGRYRKRYLDLIGNEETKERFKFRSAFIAELRKFYWENGFVEIDTPVLTNAASGALARPFKTHLNALDIDVYLRIAPEIYLKEAIVGGFDRVFEVARVFRNEGTDASHLQDFTMVEHYASYWNFEKNIEFTEKMLSALVQKLKGSLTFKAYNRNDELVEIDLTPPWRRVSFRELLEEDSGIDIENYPTADDLKKAIAENGIVIEDIDTLGRGNMIDALYKKVSRPKLVNPTFLMNHPVDISPLARKNESDPRITDRFQLVINGWEIVNAYSELIDPVDQAERFERQAAFREAGDEEAMVKDDEYVEAMEYGMPPMSGWGMGVERLLALLTEQTNLRDVVLFPLLRPKE